VDSRRVPGRPRAGLQASPARWVTSARFLLRSLNLRGPAFLLALLSITVGATVTATVLNLKAGLREKMSRELRSYGPNLLILPAAGSAPFAAGMSGGGAGLDEAVAARVGDLLGDRAVVAPVLLAAGSVQDQAATLVGTDFDRLRRLYPGWRTEEEGAATSRRTQTCVLGVSLAARADLKPGDIAELRAPGEAALRVAGIVSTGEAEDERVFVPLKVLQELASGGGRLSFAAVSVEGGPRDVENAAARITALLPGVEARPVRAIALAEGALLGRLDRMMLLLTLVVLVLSGLCLVTMLMSMVVERESEIGLARAIGAGDGEIFKMFLGEVGLIGVLGSIAGAGLGAILVRVIGSRLFDAAIEPRLSVVPQVVLASLLICVVAVLIPLRRALSIQPAAALRGD
jgi:putative ABC transport system permease protein